MEKYHGAPSDPSLKPGQHPWFLSLSWPHIYSVISYHKYFWNPSVLSCTLRHDPSPGHHCLSGGLQQPCLMPSPCRWHCVLTQTPPSHRKSLAEFLSDGTTLQYKDLHSFPLDFKIKSKLLIMAQRTIYDKASAYFSSLISHNCLLFLPLLATPVLSAAPWRNQALSGSSSLYILSLLPGTLLSSSLLD